MNEYLKLLILAYFREKDKDYSLQELSTLIGVNLIMLDNILEDLFEKQFLLYKERMIILTHKGRLKLMNSNLEEYNFSMDNFENEFEGEKWPIDRPFYVHRFSEKVWRNSCK